MTEQSCPMCRGRSDFSLRKEGFEYRRCVSCATLFVTNHMQAEDVYAHYSEAYFEASAADSTEERLGYPSYMDAQQSLKLSFSRKLDLIHSLSASGKLLDVGAAYGTFLSLASKYYECYGLDVSQYAAQVARDQFGMDVRQGSIEDTTPFADAFFDVVVMWDVIEHLTDPIKGLKEVHRILKPGGYLAISTDDAANWLPRLLGRYWWGLAAPLHLNHFSKKGLTIAIQRVGGFEEVKIVRDKREYSLGEIVSHFGVSFKNKMLADFGGRLENSSIGRRVITVSRPEQFIAMARKQDRGLE